MKRSNSFISFMFGCFILAATLIQSVHSFHHLEEEFSKEKCFHDYSKGTPQLTHSHEFDHCFTCEFAFSNSVAFESYVFYFTKTELPAAYPFFCSKEIISHFRGSLFALRAPPAFIV